MSEEGKFWFHAGVTEISETSKENGSRYVRVPDRVFRDEDILLLGHSVDWYFNEVSGVLIVTHDRLEMEDYKYTGESRKFTEGDSKYGLTVPKIFFEDGQGKRGTGVTPDPADKVQLPKEGWLHFVYHRDMAEGDKKSCYVLTEEQYSTRFSDSDVWDGSLEQAPKFHS